MIEIKIGSINAHVLGWPGCSDPSPFGLGIATDNRRFPKWAKHEPERGRYVWEDLTWGTGAHGYYRNPGYAVDEWRQHGLNVLLVLQCDVRPAWCGIDDDAAFAAWVTAACRQWRPREVEFVNEPSGSGVNQAWLVRQFAVGRAAAKAVDPTILIVGPSCESICTPGNGVEYTVAFLKAGGAAQIDVLGVHLYPHGMPTHDPRSILDQMDWLRKGIAGLWSGPIWNTESGCEGETFPTMTLERQLREIRSHCLLPIAGGCERIFWYAFGEDKLGPYLSPYLRDVCREFQRMKALEGQNIADVSRSPAGAVLHMESGELIEV